MYMRKVRAGAVSYSNNNMETTPIVLYRSAYDRYNTVINIIQFFM